jgi:hypothetical protein
MTLKPGEKPSGLLSTASSLFYNSIPDPDATWMEIMNNCPAILR